MARHARVAVDEMKELANEWRDLQRSTSVKTPALDRLRLSIEQYEPRSLHNPAEGEAQLHLLFHLIPKAPISKFLTSVFSFNIIIKPRSSTNSCKLAHLVCDYSVSLRLERTTHASFWSMEVESIPEKRHRVSPTTYE
jgi:hypothetical protein